jgi:phage repressor protein C with HTH and peptisase S24 domain
MARLEVREVAGAPPYSPETGTPSVREALGAAAPLRRAPALDLAVAAGVGRDLWDEPCERWVALPDDIPDGAHLALAVAGDSMHPLLHAGDTILVRLGAELAPDTVVVARRPDDGYVVKRVGRIGRDAVELTSLNPAYPAITIPRDDALVLGTVVLRWCAHSD